MDASPPTGFEAGLKKLEQTVKALEGGDLGLDAALGHYEAGIRLLADCHKLLDDADRKVALLTNTGPDGSPETAPFDASATFEAPAARTVPKAKVGDSLDDLPF